MDRELVERLEKIEMHLAHLEYQYDQLNEVVLEQRRRLAKMESLQQRLSDSIETIELDRIKATNPKPPHY